MDCENTENFAKNTVSPEGPVETSGTLKPPSNLEPKSRQKMDEGTHLPASASSVISEDADPTHIPGFATLLSLSPAHSSLSTPITTQQCSQHSSSQSSAPDPEGQSVDLRNNFSGAEKEKTGEASGGCKVAQQQKEKGLKFHLGYRRKLKSVSESATSGLKNRGEERFFFGAYIGNETRRMEFKKGGGNYLENWFKRHLRKYACAFVNSGGGTLLVGVDNDGIVQGICCNHKQQDQLQQLVDSVLKDFCPPLLPQSYSLTFVPVVKAGPEGNNLKVLRLTLRPQSNLSVLYQTDQGEVYLRRDGSVEGPLSPSAILEWARKTWSRDVIQLQQVSETLQKIYQRHRPLILRSVSTQTTPECATMLSSYYGVRRRRQRRRERNRSNKQTRGVIGPGPVQHQGRAQQEQEEYVSLGCMCVIL